MIDRVFVEQDVVKAATLPEASFDSTMAAENLDVKAFDGLVELDPRAKPRGGDSRSQSVFSNESVSR